MASASDLAGTASRLQRLRTGRGIGDVRRVFSGEILFAEELMSFDV